MKNLTALAAGINCYKSNEMPSHYFENKYFSENFEHATNKSYDKKEIPAFLSSMPNIEVGIFFEVRRQNVNHSEDLECYYIEHSYVFCKHIDSETVCLLRKDRNDKFSFMPNYTALNKYNSLDTSEKHTLTSKIKEPNLIGVFSEKKVIEWLTYCSDYITALEGFRSIVLNKVQEQQNAISSFIYSLNGKCKVEIFRNSTTIETKLFTITFNLDKSNGYLRSDIITNCTLLDVVKITNSL